MRSGAKATTCLIFCLVLAICAAPLQGFGGKMDLYAPGGIRLQGVRQGYVGSCYFHATVAALAQTNPEMLKRMIKENSDSSFAVQFGDGRKETVYPEDITYAQANGFDSSDGLWVIVLLRAFAQRILRQAILDITDKASIALPLKVYVRSFIESSDSVLLSYDRAIRTAVDQQGNIDKNRLTVQLREEMDASGIARGVQDAVVQLLDSGGVFETTAAMIRENGELFGAFRAVGQGGLPGRVLAALTGNPVKHVFIKGNTDAAMPLLLNSTRLPVVAATGVGLDELLASGQLAREDQNWYLKTHAFTVVKYDPIDRSVTLRNPWASHPDPDGIFVIPLAKFLASFSELDTTGAD
jgi:hypothetical protein